MNIPILVSKKGTRVVTATQLHRALQLPDHHYPTNVRRWLEDVYQFEQGIRRPEPMRDYARRKVADHISEDYYISLELAKNIALHSRSKVKMKCACWLYSMEDETASKPNRPRRIRANKKSANQLQLKVDRA